MARPKNFTTDNKTETLTIRLTPAQKQMFADVARTLEKSMGEMIITSVYLRRKELEDSGYKLLKSRKMESQLKDKRELEEKLRLADAAAEE